ncbi:MAG: mannosyltransferase YkcB-related protein, partial [Solirubrobacteraceae bacterium]
MTLLAGRAGTRSAVIAPLAFGLAATVAVEVVLLERVRYIEWLVPVLSAGGAVTLVVLLAPFLARMVPRRASGRPAADGSRTAGALRAHAARLRPAGAVGALCALLLVAPAAYSATTWLAPVQGTFPAAGPHAAAGPGDDGLYPGEPPVFNGLVGYLRAHRLGRRFGVLTVSSVTAAPLILKGIDAAALAGYGGTDPALDRRRLAKLVARHEAHYVLLGGAYSERGGNRATVAVLAACREVPSSDWNGPPLEPYSLVLFDCAGHARTLGGVPPKALRRLSHAPPARGRMRG